MLAEHLHVNLCLYVFAGLCPPTGTVSLKWPICYRVYMVITDILTILNFITIGANLVAFGVPLTKRCYSGFTCLASAQAIIKLIVCYVHRNRFGDYFKHLNNLIDVDGDNDLKEAMVKNKKHVGRLSICLFIFMVSPMIPWGTLPLFIKISSNFIPSLEDSYQFIAVPAQFPFNPMVSPAYELVTIFQGVAAVALNAKLIAFDCLLYGLISSQIVYCSYLKNCYEKLIHFIKTDQEKRTLQNISRCNSVYKTEVKNWVTKHCELIKMCRTLNELYSPVLLVQFLFNILILCSNAFVVASATVTKLELLFSFGYVVVTVVQLYILCWIGEKITANSLTLPDKGFWQEWFSCPPEVQRSLKIIFEKSKIPLKISAFGAFHLSIETFKSIVGTAFSYFMVLNQVKKNIRIE